MLIRSVVPLIIFATVAVGIAKMGDMRRVGVVRLRAIIYFEVVSTLALVGLPVGNLLQLGAGLHIILTRLPDRITSAPTASPMPSSCCSSAPRTGRIFASSRHECGPDGRTEAVQPLPGGDRGQATLTETRAAELSER
jgi:Sodium:dicarboxylate symporter family